jgi:hypothetical protein
MPDDVAQVAELQKNLEIARRWCAAQGSGWQVLDLLGRGGTASVYVVDIPSCERLLKILEKRFCEGERGQANERRIASCGGRSNIHQRFNWGLARTLISARDAREHYSCHCNWLPPARGLVLVGAENLP